MALLCLGLSALPAHAGTCTFSAGAWHPASLGLSDVTACFTNAASGDTISLQSGNSPAWSGDINYQSLGISGKKLNIIGAGAGSTIINTGAIFFDSVAANTGLSVNIPSTRLSGITFNLNGHSFTIQDTKGFRFDHDAFNQTAAVNCITSYGFASTNWGVVDHSTFNYCQQESLGGDYGNTSNGDNIAWSMASPQGTKFAIYYEDDVFINPSPASGGYFNCFDAYQGGAYVVRFSLLSGCRFEGHGVQGDNSRGTRSIEIYNDTWCGNSPTVSTQGSCPSPNTGDKGYAWSFPRGGEFKGFHNTVDNNWIQLINRADSGPRLEEDSIGAVGQVPLWQFCDGTNKSTYWTGTVTTPFNTYVTYGSNKSLIVDQQGTGGYLCRDQLGAGQDSTTWASGWNTTPPSQARVPTYFWKNPPPGGGSDLPFSNNCETPNSPGNNLCLNMKANLFVQDRDYFVYNTSPGSNQTSGVAEGNFASHPSTCSNGVGYWALDRGSWNTNLAANTSGALYVCTSNTYNLYYTPFTYPHPLISGGTSTANTPTFSPVAGTYNGGTQNVTISTTSSGAIICYNTTGSPATNGTTGCTTGTLYSGPVAVAVSETLYAVAGGTGYTDSSVGSAVYVISKTSSGGGSGSFFSTGPITTVYGWSAPPSSGSAYYADYQTYVMPQVAGNSLLLCVAGTGSPNIGYDNGSTAPNLTTTNLNTYAGLYSAKPINFVISHVANGGSNVCTSQYVATQAWADNSAPLWTTATKYQGTTATVVCWPQAQCPSAGGTLSGSPFYTLSVSGNCTSAGASGPTGDTGCGAVNWTAASHAPVQDFTFQPTGGGYSGTISFSGTITTNGSTTITNTSGDLFNSGMDQITIAGAACAGTYQIVSVAGNGLSAVVGATASAGCTSYAANSGTYNINTTNCAKCTAATLVTGFPVPWENPYFAWWEQTVTLFVNYQVTQSWNTPYDRFGITVGGERFPWNSSKLEQLVTPISPSQFRAVFLDTATKGDNYVAAALTSAHAKFRAMGAVNGGTNSLVPCSLADSEAAEIVAAGMLLGSESLSASDITNIASGIQCITTPPPGTGNDAFWIFQTYPNFGAEMQQAGASCPTGTAGAGSCSASQTGGSWISVLPFFASNSAASQHRVFEAFANDLLCTYDPSFTGNGSYTSQYSDCQSAGYQTVLSNFKSNFTGTTTLGH